MADGQTRAEIFQRLREQAQHRRAQRRASWERMLRRVGWDKPNIDRVLRGMFDAEGSSE